MMTADHAPVTVLGLGIVGAGGFAEFVCSAAADLPDVATAAVTDTNRKLAGAYTADTAADLAALLADVAKLGHLSWRPTGQVIAVANTAMLSS